VPHSVGPAEVLRSVEEPAAHQHQTLVKALGGLAAGEAVLDAQLGQRLGADSAAAAAEVTVG